MDIGYTKVNMGKKKNKVKLNEGHYHEALDRTAMVNDIFYDHIEKNGVVQEHKKLREMAEKITMDIQALYQKIGVLEYYKFGK
jgi:hypothetical protein